MTSDRPTSAFLAERIEEIARLVELAAGDRPVLDLLDDAVRQRLRPVLHRAPGAVVRLALWSECLVLAEQAVRADGMVTDDEIAYVLPLVRDAAPYLAQMREAYATIDVHAEGARSLLEVHEADPMVFGGACRATAWMALQLCRRAAERSGDDTVLVRYETMVSRLLDELFELGGVSPEEVKEKTRLRELVLRMRPDSSLATTPSIDGRVVAFCAPGGPEVFHAVASASQVYEPDPLDVEAIHADARHAFERTLERVVQPGRSGPGRVLLILGESGSGKTHLLRALRNAVHGRRLGMTAYLQMGVGGDDYARYLLGRVIDSLQQPHARPEVEDSSLMCLSDTLAERLDPEDRLALREDDLDVDSLAIFLHQQVDELLRQGALDGLHPDLLRSFLYLQRRDPATKARIMKFLRCEPLSSFDRRVLGELHGWTAAADPLRMLEQLARLVQQTHQGALVVLIDQIEDLVNLDSVGQRFRRAMDVVRATIESCPNALFVVACLEEFYEREKAALPSPVRDRIERDPEPRKLVTHRTRDEVEALVVRRLSHLYDEIGVRVREEEPLVPFRREWIERLAQTRTRDVLDRCRRFHEACVMAGRIVEWDEPSPNIVQGSSPVASTTSYENAWEAARARGAEVPDDDERSAELLAWAIRESGAKAATRTSRFVRVELGASQALLIGLCNQDPRGGALARQIDETMSRADGARVVIARSSEYPNRPGTAIVNKLGDLVRNGGRKVVVQEADWRAIAALRELATRNAREASFEKWRREARPLAQLPSIRAIVGDDLEARAAPASVPPPPAPSSAPASPAPPTAPPTTSAAAPSLASAGAAQTAATTREGGIVVGHTRGLTPKKIAIDPQRLAMHAAFLGSTGSGKTTLALHLLEELVLERVPVVLLDRKGDLGIYADPDAWARASSDPAVHAKRDALRAGIQVDVFTPGSAAGRPLSIPLVPAGIGALPPIERSQLASFAATALGGMMGLRAGHRSDEQLRVILQKAIEVVACARPDGAPTIESLVEVLDQEDASLVDAVGRLDTRHFRKLVEQLETLRLGRGELVAHGTEALDPSTLFSPGRGGRTRMTVISTKFLGDNSGIEFWVARFLATLSRWASQHPSARLQGVVLLDEADLYMPATRKPATKEPLADLLRRARSAGIGVMLATQSPGDLDYKGRDNIRTWWVGRVTADTAIEKMKPLLADARVNVATRLASLGIGEFFQLDGGNVTEVRAERSLLKTEQLPEDAIERLARASADGTR